MATKMVTDRKKAADAVAQKLTSHGPQIAAQIRELAKPFLHKGEAAPDVDALVALLGRILSGTAEAMVAADDAHTEEASDDAAPREARDASAQAVRDHIKATREMVTGIYGAAALARCGIDGETPTDPAALERYASAIVTALRKAKLPKPRVAGAKLDLNELAEVLDAERNALAAHRKDVTREDQELAATQVAKDRAVAQYDRVFQAVANTAVGLLQVAGERELADQVRPSTRRPGRTIADEPVDPTPEPKPQ